MASDSSLSSGTSGSDHKGSSAGGVSSSSGTTTEASTNCEYSIQNKDELATRETKQVRRSRAVFIMVLFSIAATAAALTYVFTSKAESQNFENEFEDYASEIRSATQNNAVFQYNALKSLALMIAAVAEATSPQWPAFSIPDFPAQADHFLESTGSEMLVYTPVIGQSKVADWEEYSVLHQGWFEDGLHYENREDELCCLPESIPESVHPDNYIEEADGVPHYLPLWQTFPTPQTSSVVNFNILHKDRLNKLIHFILATGRPVLSKVIDPTTIFGDGVNFFRLVGDGEHDHNHPHSLLLQPVTETSGANSSVVAVLSAVLPWDLYFADVIHDGVNGLVCVVQNSCDDVFTYRINGAKPVFLGYGDHHDSKYDEYDTQVAFEPFPWHSDEDRESQAYCHYEMHIYPDNTLYAVYNTNTPLVLTISVCIIFAFTSLSFVVYDRLVQIRQAKIMESAQRSNAIVSSLFPAEVRDRLFKKKAKQKSNKETSKVLSVMATEGPKFRLKNFLRDENTNPSSPIAPKQEEQKDSQPIADLFPNTTVMFADIADFTAWSSVREPSQVFILLETVYRSFDHIAKRRRVFKVETIGDCYVAVAGLPEPRKDHAVMMARFARDCLVKMGEVTRKLEVSLGPETGDLEMRFGLHSGPVTAGVLRGEKSRFQLFGDTVNVAARMESTGRKSRIHISQETADLLIEAGKEKWIELRAEKIVAKGKGELQTYWLHTKDDDDDAKRVTSGENPIKDDIIHQDHKGPLKVGYGEVEAKNDRLVDWMADVLTGLLKEVIAARPTHARRSPQEADAIRELEDEIGKGHTVLEETSGFVPLPDYDDGVQPQCLPHQVVLDTEVETQLRHYVSVIGGLYRKNPFHCFEHATHVVMSVRKLLSRIVSPENPCHEGCQFDPRLSVDDKTFGIAADKLKHFAVVFSALIHDVDHRGIPNFCVAKEDQELCDRYKGKAILEQNSVDLGWEILMGPEFDKFRACIYVTKEEMLRFRQLVVNTVIATDIFDPDLAKRRLDRWRQAFEARCDSMTLEHVSRKATIVVEHLIQASDVAHTMQHWQVYMKWNRRLFAEMYTAYKEGRLPKDPSANWYQGEIAFFDNYIIPLAKKLDHCGVFGVSSDEYLTYALNNRSEWSDRGERLVQDLKDELDRKAESA